MVELRPYRADDLEALYEICLLTGDAGQDASPLHNDRKVVGHIYAAPYGVLEPANVFVAEDGIARRASVTLGSRMPGRVEVVDGLTMEDRVIVTGQDRLSSGDRISVKDGENVIPDNRFAKSMES